MNKEGFKTMTLELVKTAKGYKRIDECNPLNVFRYDYSHTTNRIICNGERVVADVYVAVSPKETLRRIVVGMVGAGGLGRTPIRETQVGDRRAVALLSATQHQNDDAERLRVEFVLAKT